EARARAPPEAARGAQPKASTERVRMAAKRTLARTSRAVGQLEGRERPNRDDEPGQGAKGWQAPIGARRDATAARRRE
ncbi:hypothetical protein DQE55_25630, partial [Salmonella enterica subsp. enterica]|nr:hypothetical protein [Salmonella enterica subsp. enterica]